MDIRIIRDWKSAGQAEGLAVIIDVYRAFTTACVIMEQRPRSCTLCADLDYFRQLKEGRPDTVCIGERGGEKLSFADHGNSPSEIARQTFTGKDVVMNTSAGTQGMMYAVNATDRICGSFANVGAILAYIHSQKPSRLSLVCTNDYTEVNEDTVLAEYIREALTGQSPSLEETVERLRLHPCSAWFFDPSRLSHPLEDIEYCLQPDRYSFVLRADSRDKNTVRLACLQL
jgi:2-phosphosulfolactate phosphatase